MSDTLPRAVIFDWDNTLVDSWGAISEAINYARGKYGLETWNREQILANCTRSAREAFPDWFGDKWEDAWFDYYSYFNEIRKRVGINKANGAEELLAWLFQHKIPAVVVSNKNGDYLRDEAEQLGWKKYFSALVGAHDAPRDKPAREHADRALLLAGLENGEDIWFIGDSESDMTCAKSAECLPVLIGKPRDAKAMGVNKCFGSCADVLDYLIGLEAMCNKG